MPRFSFEFQAFEAALQTKCGRLSTIGQLKLAMLALQETAQGHDVAAVVFAFLSEAPNDPMGAADRMMAALTERFPSIERDVETFTWQERADFQ